MKIRLNQINLSINMITNKVKKLFEAFNNSFEDDETDYTDIASNNDKDTLYDNTRKKFSGKSLCTVKLPPFDPDDVNEGWYNYISSWTNCYIYNEETKEIYVAQPVSAYLGEDLLMEYHMDNIEYTDDGDFDEDSLNSVSDNDFNIIEPIITIRFYIPALEKYIIFYNNSNITSWDAGTKKISTELSDVLRGSLEDKGLYEFIVTPWEGDPKLKDIITDKNLLKNFHFFPDLFILAQYYDL